MTRSYTHTSASHHTHAQIDYIFLPALDCCTVQDVTILSRGLSDHSPVVLRLGGLPVTSRPIWRLNAWFLQDQDFRDRVGEELRHYFDATMVQ